MGSRCWSSFLAAGNHQETQAGDWNRGRLEKHLKWGFLLSPRLTLTLLDQSWLLLPGGPPPPSPLREGPQSRKQEAGMRSGVRRGLPI